MGKSRLSYAVSSVGASPDQALYVEAHCDSLSRCALCLEESPRAARVSIPCGHVQCAVCMRRTGKSCIVCGAHVERAAVLKQTLIGDEVLTFKRTVVHTGISADPTSRVYLADLDVCLALKARDLEELHICYREAESYNDFDAFEHIAAEKRDLERTIFNVDASTTAKATDLRVYRCVQAPHIILDPLMFRIVKNRPEDDEISIKRSSLFLEERFLDFENLNRLPMLKHTYFQFKEADVVFASPFDIKNALKLTQNEFSEHKRDIAKLKKKRKQARSGAKKEEPLLDALIKLGGAAGFVEEPPALVPKVQSEGEFPSLKVSERAAAAKPTVRTTSPGPALNIKRRISQRQQRKQHK